MVEMIQTSTPIDDLTGGLEAGTLLLIYGPTGCGKTTLCLRMAENILKAGEYNVIYIDTEGGAPEVQGVRFIRVRDLREQGEALKKLRKEGPSRALIFLDSMTAQYHRRVLSAPAEFRASTAAELGGVIAKHLGILREIVEGTENVAIVTAHLKSPVEYNFKMNMLRKMAKAWRDGRYTPSAGDYMKFFAEDPVKRILYIEKWPLKYNYCIRYVMDKALNIQKVGGLFDLQDQMRRKILGLEFKSMLGEVLEVSEKEGIEVEEGASEVVVKPAEAAKKRKRGELRLPKVPSLGDIAEEEAKGEADEPGDSGPG
jgi:energy-coupling factor transporter ATP-binding protein EcfA2